MTQAAIRLQPKHLRKYGQDDSPQLCLSWRQLTKGSDRIRTISVEGMKSALVAQDAALLARDPNYKPVLDPEAASRMPGFQMETKSPGLVLRKGWGPPGELRNRVDTKVSAGIMCWNCGPAEDI